MALKRSLGLVPPPSPFFVPGRPGGAPRACGFFLSCVACQCLEASALGSPVLRGWAPARGRLCALDKRTC
eukprot:1612058-Alexandrium_andersonii.AAC.1